MGKEVTKKYFPFKTLKLLIVQSSEKFRNGEEGAGPPRDPPVSAALSFYFISSFILFIEINKLLYLISIW